MASKIMFRSYDTPSFSGSPLKTIGAVINPETYSQSNTVNYGAFSIKGDSAQTYFFNNVGDNILKLPKLIVDGTGIIPLEGADNVDDYLDQLATTVYKYNGAMHSPPFVKISWGTMTFKGICTSCNVNYTLFDITGKLLRATVDLEFKSSVDPQTKAAQASNSSPDLTHIRVVKAGDTLPLISYRIYGDSSYYLEVARINGLNSTNAIKPGDRIYFPPIKK
jgi:LysM repeat protein